MYGSVKKTRIFDCDLSPGEMTVSSQGDLLCVDYATKTVNNVKHDRIESVLTVPLGKTPHALCCSKSGDIEQKNVLYYGQKLLEDIKIDEDGNKTF